MEVLKMATTMMPMAASFLTAKSWIYYVVAIAVLGAVGYWLYRRYGPSAEKSAGSAAAAEFPEVSLAPAETPQESEAAYYQESSSPLPPPQNLPEGPSA